MSGLSQVGRKKSLDGIVIDSVKLQRDLVSLRFLETGVLIPHAGWFRCLPYAFHFLHANMPSGLDNHFHNFYHHQEQP